MGAGFCNLMVSESRHHRIWAGFCHEGAGLKMPITLISISVSKSMSIALFMSDLIFVQSALSG